MALTSTSILRALTPMSVRRMSSPWLGELLLRVGSGVCKLLVAESSPSSGCRLPDTVDPASPSGRTSLGRGGYALAISAAKAGSPKQTVYEPHGTRFGRLRFLNTSLSLSLFLLLALYEVSGSLCPDCFSRRSTPEEEMRVSTKVRFLSAFMTIPGRPISSAWMSRQ